MPVGQNESSKAYNSQAPQCCKTIRYTVSPQTRHLNVFFCSSASLLQHLLPTGHPPPGDFIALGSKSQGGEPKAPAVLLKPASTGLPADRKRETSSALPSSSGLSSLAKRPKLSTTPPVSALGRLADVAAVDKRAISPSIKEPSVVPIEGKSFFFSSKVKVATDLCSIYFFVCL